MSIFQFQNYREFIKAKLATRPNAGRGELTKIAKDLRVHTTLVSLILSGDRELTMDQAFDLAAYFDLTELETEYFVLLVQLERAGNARAREFTKKKIIRLQQESQKIAKRFEHEKTLTEAERTTFYSSWLYSAVSLFLTTESEGLDIEAISKRFRLSRKETAKICNFLAEAGLAVTKDGNTFKVGTRRTFLEFGSPHLAKHHTNWRIMSCNKAATLREDELMFTGPCSMSQKDFGIFRERLAELLKEFSRFVYNSPAENMACFNLDFYWLD